MGHFIECEYHGTERIGQNPPVNFDLVTNITSQKTDSCIVFEFSKGHKIEWTFINSETRNQEFKRIMKLLKNKTSLTYG